MASCGQCGTQVGCACNLILGVCASCYNKKVESGEAAVLNKKTKKKVVVQKTPKDPKPVGEFTEILNSGLSREEKLRRINDILEKAKEQANDKSKTTDS